MTKIIAHRGYHTFDQEIIENTLESFNNAYQNKADGIEFDVHLTNDHEFIVYHDFKIKSGKKPQKISELSLEEIKKLDLGSGVRIPYLNEVLEQFGNKFLLNIEIKSQNESGKKLAEVIRKSDLDLSSNYLIVSSFHSQMLLDIKKYCPEISTGLLCTLPRIHSKATDFYKKFDFIHPFYDNLPFKTLPVPKFISRKVVEHYSGRFIRKNSANGFMINLWTVNSTEYIKKAFKSNIFGIITDFLEKAKELKKYY